jgi:hypothetical protein
MKKMRWSVIVGLLFLLCASCVSTETVIQSADVVKLRLGMTEKEVIAVLHLSPNSRRYYLTDSTYLLRWGNAREKEGKGDITCLTILFQHDCRMIAVVDQENLTMEGY